MGDKGYLSSNDEEEDDDANQQQLKRFRSNEEDDDDDDGEEEDSSEDEPEMDNEALQTPETKKNRVVFVLDMDSLIHVVKLIAGKKRNEMYPIMDKNKKKAQL